MRTLRTRLLSAVILVCAVAVALAGLAGLTGLAGPAGPNGQLPSGGAVMPATAETADRTELVRWRTGRELRSGQRDGVRITRGRLRIADEPAGRVRVRDPWGSGKRRRFDVGRWTSPWVAPGFPARSLVPSWNAVTRPGTFVRIDVRTRSDERTGSWDEVAVWAHQVTAAHRHSGGTQSDDLARLLVDTVVANDPHRLTGWQVRVVLFRRSGSTRTPRVASLGAVAATYLTRDRGTSRTALDRRRVLRVPPYSQMVHEGHHPEWNGGGEAWCSPTSVAMVLDHYGRGPTEREYAWTDEPDGQVDHAARFTYDHAYTGTGNWPFNTAYAGQRGLDAFVTRLHSLRDAERFIAAGIPLVVSISFGAGELEGAPLTSTPGHLLVIRGFNARRNVVVNDPAGATNAEVRRVYRRGQFERAWLRGSGGIAYVIRPLTRALPADSPRW